MITSVEGFMEPLLMYKEIIEELHAYNLEIVYLIQLIRVDMDERGLIQSFLQY